MKSGEEVLTANDGVALYTCWTRPPTTRASVLIVHGVGDHIGRYEHLRNHLNAAGYACIGYDQRGHGRSGGPRTHVRAFSQYVDDLALVYGRLREREDHAPFLFGHSMGSIVALLHAAVNPHHWRGVVVAGCPIRPAQAPPAWQAAVGEMCSAVIPQLRMQSRIAPADLSRDATVGERYMTDDRVEKTITLRWGMQFLQSIEDVLAVAVKIVLPILLLHGSADKIADVEGARMLFARLGSKDKTLKEYPGMRHELHNEREADRETVFSDIVSWLAHH